VTLPLNQRVIDVLGEIGLGCGSVVQKVMNNATERTR